MGRVGLAVMGLACRDVGGPTLTGETATSAETGGTGGTAGTGGTDSTEPPPPDELPDEPGIWGTVIGPDLAPLPEFDVMGCTASTCNTVESAQNGVFWIPMMPGDVVALKTHETDDYAAALEPCLVQNSGLDAGLLYVPSHPPETHFVGDESTPQLLDVGAGLVLTVVEADLVAPFGVFLQGVGAVAVPSEYWPTYAELGAERLIGVLALAPFGTGSTSPVGLIVDTTEPAGTTVHFWAVDALGGVLLGPAVGVSDGERAATLPGQGIETLTHVVVSVP